MKVKMNCHYCKNTCIKKGKDIRNNQKYFCKTCKKHQLSEYQNKACAVKTNKMIVKLLCNGSGIRDISRVLEISKNTVISKIKEIAQLIKVPTTFYKGRNYEVDELKTFVSKKQNEYWICCGLDKTTKEVVSMSVGKRTKATIHKTLVPLILSEPNKIHTDRLKHYKSLIEETIHNVKQYTINKMERKFLNFRTHLKRLCRRSICFSKTSFMLEATVKIYLWNASLIFQ